MSDFYKGDSTGGTGSTGERETMRYWSCILRGPSSEIDYWETLFSEIVTIMGRARTDVGGELLKLGIETYLAQQEGGDHYKRPFRTKVRDERARLKAHQQHVKESYDLYLEMGRDKFIAFCQENGEDPRVLIEQFDYIPNAPPVRGRSARIRQWFQDHSDLNTPSGIAPRVLLEQAIIAGVIQATDQDKALFYQVAHRAGLTANENYGVWVNPGVSK